MYPYTEYFEPYLREVRDFLALGNAIDPEARAVLAHMEQVYRNQFVTLCDEETLRRKEVLFKISADPANESLEYRRQRLLARMIFKLPITMRTLRRYLKSIDPEAFEQLYPEEYAIYFWLNGLSVDESLEVLVYLRQMIPANLALYIGEKRKTSATIYAAALANNHNRHETPAITAWRARSRKIIYAAAVANTYSRHRTGGADNFG